MYIFYKVSGLIKQIWRNKVFSFNYVSFRFFCLKRTGEVATTILRYSFLPQFPRVTGENEGTRRELYLELYGGTRNVNLMKWVSSTSDPRKRKTSYLSVSKRRVNRTIEYRLSCVPSPYQSFFNLCVSLSN